MRKNNFAASVSDLSHCTFYFDCSYFAFFFVTACPKCFDLVQLAVNKLRERLSKMNLTRGNFTNKDAGIDVRDENFENAIRALDKAINELKQKTDGLLDGDKKLFEFFDELRKQFEKINNRLAELKTMVKESEQASENGKVEITKAEEIIEEIKRLLKDAEDKIKKEGEKLFNKSGSSAADLSDIAKEMRAIAKEVKNILMKILSIILNPNPGFSKKNFILLNHTMQSLLFL